MAAVIPNPLAPLSLSQHMADLPVGESFVGFVVSFNLEIFRESHTEKTFHCIFNKLQRFQSSLVL